MEKNIELAIENIKKVFGRKNKIRYRDIEHIEKHHEALKEMEYQKMVDVYFIGYKVYIEKNYDLTC